jgi:hypothetical protein
MHITFTHIHEVLPLSQERKMEGVENNLLLHLMIILNLSGGY